MRPAPKLTAVQDVRGSEIFARSDGSQAVSFWWLGQAGFAFRYGETLMLIDPYLSDFLAKKYRGKEFPHTRMMQPPVAAEDISDLSFILCTHRHSDHMDPETLPVLMKNNTACVLLAPEAEFEWVSDLGIDTNRFLGVDAGDEISLSGNVKVRAIPSAHEELRTDARGRHYYLGYILDFGGLRAYHSGDCVPYEGLEHTLSSHAVDVALLPVNGRDEFRRTRNVPGNFSFEEAAALCDACGIPLLVCHHFGMFEFNTVEPDQALRSVAGKTVRVRYVFPKPGTRYEVEKD